ncbi:MAG: 50S ribosomal protein L4 [Planctomycetaceae bacterium]|nr:50S ribosomal protein L4 [Planctomycetaceae bacterium]
MVSAPLKNASGTDIGSYEFDPADLAPGINKQLLHDVVVMYEANKRAGTVKTKSRGMVSGSTKKLYRQKGTGRARAGNRRTPVRVGGGHAFGKTPKDWSYRLPKQAIRLATRMALLSKFQDDEAIVLDALAVDAPKTRVIADMLGSLGVGRESCLLTVRENDPVVWRSGRNIESLWVSPAAELNAYKLLHQKRLIVTKEAIDFLRGLGQGA